ncbi:membrane protein insertion efficiency factor YidD [Candidatus Gracilibacteria bacterium]|nr:membrane protein insertion efficiency factor YidD [Candidatus Gracilibacteria bacterium]
MKKILIFIIEVYQKYLSPDHSFWARKNNNPPYCKHYPTCSEYTKEAIEKKGALMGSLKGIGRILRCMPWNKGGYDPVDKN